MLFGSVLQLKIFTVRDWGMCFSIYPYRLVKSSRKLLHVASNSNLAILVGQGASSSKCFLAPFSFWLGGAIVTRIVELDSWFPSLFTCSATGFSSLVFLRKIR